MSKLFPDSDANFSFRTNVSLCFAIKGAKIPTGRGKGASCGDGPILEVVDVGIVGVLRVALKALTF